MSQKTTIMNDEPVRAEPAVGERAPGSTVPPPPGRVARGGEGPLAGVARFVRESQAELRKVTWPTREQTINLTIVVVAVCLVMTVFLGVVDSVFQYVVQQIIGT